MASSTASSILTLADLLDSLGGISPARVRFSPAPGSATEADVTAIEARENRLYELVDGVLVEKVMGYRESLLGAALVAALKAFVSPRRLGLVSTADGMLRLFPGLVRIPDAAFVPWSRIPGGRVPVEPIPHLVPDLAVEVLSPGNTPDEMQRKLREYFAAGVRLVWLVDPERRTVRVHTSSERGVELGEADTLGGGEVLAGFALPLAGLFAELDQTAD